MAGRNGGNGRGDKAGMTGKWRGREGENNGGDKAGMTGEIGETARANH